MFAFEQQEWTPELLEEVRRAKDQFDIGLDATAPTSRITAQSEFPPDPMIEGMSRQQRRALGRQLAKQQR